MLRNTKFFGWKPAGALAAALLFGMMAVGCGSDDDGTPAELNGTWIADENNDGIALVLSSGSFEFWAPAYFFAAVYDDWDDDDYWEDDYYSYYDDEIIPFVKGSFSISGNRVTLNPNKFHGDALNIMMGFEDTPFEITSKWYTKSELKKELKDKLGYIYTMGDGDKAVDQLYDEMADQFIGSRMTYELDDDILYLTNEDGETAVFTRSTMPLRKSKAVKKAPAVSTLFNIRGGLPNLKAAFVPPSVEN